jgi:hypothetical protein
VGIYAKKLRLSAIRVGVLAVSLFTAGLSRGQQSGPPSLSTPASAPTELPNAPSVYAPLSGHDKFELFLRRTYSPYTFVTAAAETTWAQMWGQWPEYGGGLPGWGKRFGAILADTESRRFIQTFLLSTLLHQDPRYFRSGKKGLISRGWYAATRVFVTRDDDGDSTFNTAELLGTLFTSSLQNAYYPASDRGFPKTMTRFVGALGSDATSDITREFWPDVRCFFRKHEPKDVKNIESKIPRRIQDAVEPPGASRCR